MTTIKGPHYYGPVDDCLRCLFCEVLPGAAEPCHANDIQVVPSTTDYDGPLPGPWMPFGSHVDLPDHLALEFSETDDDMGLPTSERVISP